MMKDFLRQNWLWIVIPLLLMVAVIVGLMAGAGADDSTGNGGYQIF